MVKLKLEFVEVIIVLKNTADKIILFLNEISIVNKSTLYGSLITNTYDELSDIDIEVDVSGYDNGKFMMELVEIFKNKYHIYYFDYAPSLVPNKYIVSFEIDKNNPFLIVDICCYAEPHCTTITKQQVVNKKEFHILKLWTANLKHYIRGNKCYDDIVRMAKKIPIENLDRKNETQLLAETLNWIENNTEAELQEFVASCRSKFEELINYY